MKHKRGTKKDKLTPSDCGATLALLAVLTVVGAGYPASAASAAPASTTSSDRLLSTSGSAGQVASSVENPTLTNDVGQPGGGAGGQLYLGIGLVAVGLLGLVYGLGGAVHDKRGRRPQAIAARQGLAQRTR